MSGGLRDLVLWRKRKGLALVRLDDGSEFRAELHWYEAHGLGRVEVKIERFPDDQP